MLKVIKTMPAWWLQKFKSMFVFWLAEDTKKEIPFHLYLHKPRCKEVDIMGFTNLARHRSWHKEGVKSRVTSETRD